MPDTPEPYDASHFDPPAPVAPVTLRGQDGAATVPYVPIPLSRNRRGWEGDNSTSVK